MMNLRNSSAVLGALLLSTFLGACSSVQEAVGIAPRPAEPDPMEARAAVVAALPASPKAVAPAGPASRKVWMKALDDRKLRIVVSRERRALWLMRDSIALFRAPVAIGSPEKFQYRGRTWDFTTPVGIRKVKGRAEKPLWVPPEWHYYEKAVDQQLRPVHLKKGSKVALEDGTRIEVRGDQVGRVNRYGNFWPFTAGMEIVFDGKIFVPPYGTLQRSVPEILGTHKLDLGDGYLIHGTNEEGSIGEAVSHGCVRMYNEDVAKLYAMVPNGTSVYIY